LAKSALSNPQIYILDKMTIKKYSDDSSWIQFLSAHSDSGQPLPKTDTQLKVLGDYLIAKSLLLPGGEEVVGLDVQGL
jgi:hypothetical protein